MNLSESVWVIVGSPSMRIPLAVFDDLVRAVDWIDLQDRSYAVAEYPVDLGLLEWMRRTGGSGAATTHKLHGEEAASFVRLPTPISKDPTSRADRLATVGTPSQKSLVWLWISYLPDRRPLPSGIFGSPESAESFIPAHKESEPHSATL
jgi:hypothetical protein